LANFSKKVRQGYRDFIKKSGKVGELSKKSPVMLPDFSWKNQCPDVYFIV
jgi:hypothetical protein